VIDFDPAHTRFLYGPPEPAECATDLIPLMTGLTPRNWYNFKRNYQLHRPDGERVFDLIERGDKTGYRQAIRRGDFKLALTLLDEAQRLADVDALAELARLADRRTFCYRNLGEYKLALRSQTETIALAEEGRLPDLGWYILNLIILYRDAGHIDLAESTLKKFITRTDHAADNEKAFNVGRKLMEVIRVNPWPPPGLGESLQASPP